MNGVRERRSLFANDCVNGVHYFRKERERERERANLPNENGNGRKKLDERSNERVVTFCSTLMQLSIIYAYLPMLFWYILKCFDVIKIVSLLHLQ